MKRPVAVALFSLLAIVPALAQTADVRATPAEQAIARERLAVEKNPGAPEGYNSLAMALARRARETSDTTYYSQGEDAVRKSLSLAPDNYGALRARAWLLLGKHQFAEARALAVTLNKRMPDDLMIYGFLTDANVELGNYDEAEAACNWMLKLRPGNIPALTRAAFLRELFGDPNGALELMTMAYESTPSAETEDRAWTLTQIAHLKLLSGATADAEAAAQRALALFPEYHYALAVLAKVRTEQKRFAEAVDLLNRRRRAAPHAENLYDLAEALKRAGRLEEASKAFVEFEARSLAETAQADNSNRELIFYYADHAGNFSKAVEVAREEFNRRHDVYTLDAYAWALHVNGRDAEARRHIETALRVGVRDARIYHHAREIASALGEEAAESPQ